MQLLLNWDKFNSLAGSAERNFENLCRSLVRLHYGRFGKFIGIANQPGVEFHLELTDECALGKAGKWIGWQCRWYDLPSGRAIGNTRKKKIEESIRKSEVELPGLTDWYLWTRHTLTKGDQEWFKAINSKLQLHLNTSADAETLLSGDAEFLRGTYFGDLILTPDKLRELHELSTAPIKKRWLPDAHQAVDAERRIRKVLGETEAWEELQQLTDSHDKSAEVLLAAAATIPGHLTTEFHRLQEEPIRVSRFLGEIRAGIQKGDYETVCKCLASFERTNVRQLEVTVRRLRSARLKVSLEATNTVADIRDSHELITSLAGSLSKRLLAVLADAGGGKTQLAAQVSSALADRPAGILLHGRELHSGRTLDDLARSIVVNGNAVPSMEALFAAVDAAGERANRRIPVVIDGLNESENPQDWKGPLAAADVLLQRFRHVILIVTVRTGARVPETNSWPPQQHHDLPARLSFVEQAIPDGIECIEIPDFGNDVSSAIKKYFSHFRIRKEDAALPMELLRHPLTLRIYCEVANEDRTREVGTESLPQTLSGLYARYIENASRRIVEIGPRSYRYTQEDILRAIDEFGWMLWESDSRDIGESEFRIAINDSNRPWNESMVHLLEREGIILRVPGPRHGKMNLIAVYDALGGYLIADTVVSRMGRNGIAAWLKDETTARRLSGSASSSHPLALDVFRSLVGTVSRRLHISLWKIVDRQFEMSALALATELEARYLDIETVEALEGVFSNNPKNAGFIFLRLRGSRASENHPLNADFFDRSLRSLSMAERDLIWTEWVRKHRKEIEFDLREQERSWKANVTERSKTDFLRAKWTMWLLTTTSHILRDLATRALYWYGRGDAASLFGLTESSATMNDPYIFERMLAASYGVAMALHCDPKFSEFKKTTLPNHAKNIYQMLFDVAPSINSTHLLTLEYGQRLIELAMIHNRKLFSSAEFKRSVPPFDPLRHLKWEEFPVIEVESHGRASPFRMDFENYTIGGLVEGRGNYDYGHAAYQSVRKQILWRIHELGWSFEKFGDVDESIGSERHYRAHMSDHYGKVDRYGKKYSWIAYFEQKGRLRDLGTLRHNYEEGRTWDADIDPSFPDLASECRIVSDDVLGGSVISTSRWIKEGPTPSLEHYLYKSDVVGQKGPWVLLDGYFSKRNDASHRSCFAFFRSFLVSKSDAKRLIRLLSGQELGGRWLPEKPSSYRLFAGEVPWCKTVASSGKTKLTFVTGEHEVAVNRQVERYYHKAQELDLSSITLSPAGEYVFSIVGRDTQVTLNKSEFDKIQVRKQRVSSSEIVQKIEEVPVQIPVHDFDWEDENADNVKVHGVTLSKFVADKCKLVNLPQTLDLQSKTGERATIGIVHHPGSYSDAERFFYIRRQVLKPFLRNNNMQLVWAIWGERELVNGEGFSGGSAKNDNQPRHVNFQQIYAF